MKKNTVQLSDAEERRIAQGTGSDKCPVCGLKPSLRRKSDCPRCGRGLVGK